MTELFGDDVVPDPVQDLIVTLKRKGIVVVREGSNLYGHQASGSMRSHSVTTYSGILSNLWGFNCITYSFSI